MDQRNRDPPTPSDSHLAVGTRRWRRVCPCALHPCQMAGARGEALRRILALSLWRIASCYSHCQVVDAFLMGDVLFLGVTAGQEPELGVRVREGSCCQLVEVILMDEPQVKSRVVLGVEEAVPARLFAVADDGRRCRGARGAWDPIRFDSVAAVRGSRPSCICISGEAGALGMSSSSAAPRQVADESEASG